MERGESSGRSLVICDLVTTACTAADKAKPRISAHKISQAIPNARERASKKAFTMAALRYPHFLDFRK